MSVKEGAPGTIDEVGPRRRGKRVGPVLGAALVAASGYVEMALALVRSILVMRLLGPTGRGIIGLVQLAEQYLSNIHLGALHGVTKQLPLELGKGSEGSAASIEDVGTTWVLVTAFVGAVGMTAAGLLWPDLGTTTRAAFIIGGGIFLADNCYNIYKVILRSWRTFHLVAAGSLIYAATLTACMILGAAVGGVEGAALGWLMAGIVSVWFFDTACRLNIVTRFDWQVVGRLISTGLPLAALAFADVLLVTGDAVVLSRRGAHSLGLFIGVAVQTRRYLFNIVRAAGFVLMPHFIAENARRTSRDWLRKSCLTAVETLCVLVPYAGFAAAVLLPIAVHYLVPRFEPAVPAGQVAALGVGLLAAPIVLGYALVACNREMWALPAKALGGLCTVGLAWVPAGRGDLVQTAAAAAMGAAIGGVAMIIASVPALRLGVRGVLALFVSHFGPVALAAGCFVLGRGAAAAWGFDLLHWQGVLIALAVGSAMYLPVLLIGQKRVRLLSRLKEQIRAAELG